MSPLRKCLKHPGSYLLLLSLLGVLVCVDARRPPECQITSQGYIRVVGAYQRVGSPLLRGYIQCRYRPTCSRYSVEAVRKYGMERGMVLTARRLWRCRTSVPLGSGDEVP
ncbi:MAG: membrane protein insertion efficiency factor YidD [Acidobacteriia bacterium]|nr:membrane protein insertion efficiency factor YidD [Terriglobia bacterium]MBZ5644876.1 membrane protein insertion efficiency factor YidD [Terriglobia bacterium]